MLSVTYKAFMLSAVKLIVIMLNVVMLNVVMLSVVMLSIVMLSVVAPFFPLQLNYDFLRKKRKILLKTKNVFLEKRCHNKLACFTTVNIFF
jgi:hypothetical protein